MTRITKIKPRFWSENSPSEEPGKPPTEKRDKRPQRSKESSLNPESDPRTSKREKRKIES